MQLNITLRAQLIFIIASMGAIVLLCTSIIVEIYSDAILKQQIDSTKTLLQQETKTQLQHHRALLIKMGFSLANSKQFRKDFSNRNVEQIKIALDDEFETYYVRALILEISKIYVFDLDFNLIAESSQGKEFGIKQEFCKNAKNIAKIRTGAERIKSLAGLCNTIDHSFQTVIIPIGTLKPTGFMQIISEPYNILKKIETKLSHPIRLASSTNLIAYQTANWNELIKLDNILEITYSEKSSLNEEIFRISVARNFRTQNKTFSQLKNTIFFSVGLLTVIAVILSLFVFEKYMIKPLNMITNHLKKVIDDKSFLGHALPVNGSNEIKLLTSGYNELGKKLSSLHLRLEEIAYVDPLTTLPNRTQLQEILDFSTSLYQKNKVPFSLLIMDLDRFKSVNDTLGHQAGDTLLKEVSDRLSSVLRKSDHLRVVSEMDSRKYNMKIVARLGGDEFAAVLSAVEHDKDAIIVAQKITSAMKSSFVIDGYKFSVGVSIGIAMCPHHGITSESLMQHADIAMYQAKKSQTGYAVFSAQHNENSISALSITDELRTAIIDDSLELHYQPKIDLSTNQLIGVEALLRWNHPQHGRIMPDKFIPIAEQTGLINDLSAWVLKTALLEKAQWERQGIYVHVAINISAKNLLCDELVDLVQDEIFRYKMDASQLFLEITETAIMSDQTHALIALHSLHDMGVKLSIDDFGTGYSSLSYLKKLPVDEIKIDKSFVFDVETNENDKIIVQSTIDLAHNMKLLVNAEGVENLAVLETLKNMECDTAQGFYICKPKPNHEFIQWVEQYNKD